MSVPFIKKLLTNVVNKKIRKIQLRFHTLSSTNHTFIGRCTDVQPELPKIKSLTGNFVQLKKINRTEGYIVNPHGLN